MNKIFYEREKNCVRTTILLLLTLLLPPLIEADDALRVAVTARADAASSQPKVLVSWVTTLTFTTVSVSWQQCTYTDLVTCRELGRQALADPKATSLQLVDALKFGAQFLVTVRGADACRHVTSSSAYVTLHRPSKDHPRQHEHLYLVLGPVTASNVTVEWRSLLGDALLPEALSLSSYRVSWRRVDGSVGHPGHDTTLVTTKHLIQGLLPATRYEVCVAELGRSGQTVLPCAQICTLETVPGPPAPTDAWCGTAAQGTHWRCDVTWRPPVSSNGKIVSYTVQWRDSEGYTLHTAHPLGTLCAPSCQSSAVLSFLPHEACVAAATAVGGGWAACVQVHDTRSRALAALDWRLLYVAAGTLLLGSLGPRLLGALCRCCIRGLARQVDGHKDHNV